MTILTNPRVTQILKSCGFYDGLSHINPEVLEYARNRGTLGHKARELYDNGNLDFDSLDEILRPYIEGWINFKRDFNFITLESEVAFSSIFGFCGTLDLVGTANGSLCLIDTKFTSSINEAVAYQTAAYTMGYAELKGVRIENRLCVQLLPKGKKKYRVREYKDNRDFKRFLGCLDIHNIKNYEELK